MKFKKILLELDKVKSRSFDRWEIFKENGDMKIRHSGSTVARDLGAWISEKKENLEATKMLVNKILNTNKNFDKENIIKILESIFSTNNKIPDFKTLVDKSGKVEDVVVGDEGELNRAKEAAKLRQLAKDYQI